MKNLTLLFLVIFHTISAEKLPQKVIICGTCKDVASRVSYSIKIMEKIGQLFSDYRIIVYENNSTDKTPQILRQWVNANSRVLVMSENISKTELEHLFINRLRSENQETFRPEPIARARNIVLKLALSENYQNFDFLILMDMDFKLEPSYDGIKEVFTTKREWDAVFAYGIDPPGTFWDWYAFRDEKYPIGSELLGSYWWYIPKKLVLSKNHDWHPVYSAFGGCGIYKKSSIAGCYYSALVTKDLAKFYHTIIQTKKSHPLIQKYLSDLKNIQKYITIKEASPNLPDICDPYSGIITDGIYEDIIWRMSSFVYKFPSVCEHVTLHASMIINGHNKLFINPRLIFRYGG